LTFPTVSLSGFVVAYPIGRYSDFPVSAKVQPHKSRSVRKLLAYPIQFKFINRLPYSMVFSDYIPDFSCAILG